MALFHLTWLLLAIPAHAGLFDGRATLPHCRAKVSAPVECGPEKSADALTAILPLAEKITDDEQLRRMKEYGHRRITSELSTSIKARKALLACLKTKGDPDCAQRLGLLRTQLEKNVQRLRIALALSRVPQAPQDRSVPIQLQLPASLGATPLPPLSPREADQARAFQRSSVEAGERVGLEKLRTEFGRTETAAELTKRCASQDPDLLEFCARAGAVHEASFLEFRRSMGKISESIIGELPFALSFSSVPINDAQLTKALETSLATLKEWKEDNGEETDDDSDSRSTFLSDNLAFTDEYVAAHPEACAAAERNIRVTSAIQIGKDALTSARDVAAITVVCSVASPLVCISASGAVFAKDTHAAYGEWSQVRRRLASADRPNPQANLVATDDAFRDLLVTAALDGMDTVSYAKWALKGGEDFYPLKEFVKDVEGDPKSFAGTAGEMFETLQENVRDDLKLAAITSVGETANGQLHRSAPGSYGDWLRSDAYTARLYQAFDQHMDKIAD